MDRTSLILSGYVVLSLAALVAYGALGTALYNTAPVIYDAWEAESAHGINPAIILVQLAIALPVAFGVSSVVYGALGGWLKFLLGLFGVAASLGFANIVLLGLLITGCYGWSSCP